MAGIYSIEWEGQDLAKCEDLGIAVVSLVFRNLDADVVTLRIETAHTDEAIIPVGTKLNLWRDGVQIFRGVAGEPIYLDGLDFTGQTVAVKGPWDELEASSYFKEGGILNLDNPLPPTTLNSWDFLRDYIELHASSVVSMPVFEETGLYDLSFTSVMGVYNQSWAQNFAALLGSYVKAVAVFDYSTTPPTMVIRQRDDVVKSLAWGDQVISRELSKNDKLPQRVSVRLTFPWSLLPEPPPGETLDALGQFLKSTEAFAWPESGAEGGPGTLVLFYVWDQLLKFPLNAHKHIYNLLNDPFWQGSVVIQDDDSLGIRPGDTINITGSASALATMRAIVQNVDCDPLNGRTTLELGISGRLDGETVVERLQAYLRTHWGWSVAKYPPALLEV